MKQESRIHNLIIGLFSLLLIAVMGRILYWGQEYYLLPLAQRPHHELYRLLRSAGLVGHGLGIVGSAMVLLLLVYSLRKRVRFMRRWGNLRVWLRYHIFLGIAGPLLITLHTAFKVQGLVAVSYYSMVAVAVSGFVGRYLYQQIPRNVLGEALSEEFIEQRREEILLQLSTTHKMSVDGLNALEDLALRTLGRVSSPVGLIILPVINLGLVRKLHTWSVGVPLDRPDGGAELALEWVILTRRLHLFRQINSLFHYWHVFHKPFAVIMILVMIVHVTVALVLGYTWLA